jgi:hypothetical protein
MPMSDSMQMSIKKRVRKISKQAKEAGQKGGKKAQVFLNSKEGKMFVKVVMVALPFVLNRLPQTKKIKALKKLLSQIF